jgi:hypothetical protein
MVIFRAHGLRPAASRAGVTQLAECLLPKPERLSAVAPLVVIPPNRLGYTLSISAAGGGLVRVLEEAGRLFVVHSPLRGAASERPIGEVI